MRIFLPAFVAAMVSVPLQAAGTAKLALSFEANQGQTDPRVQFLSRGKGHTLFLTAAEAVLRTGSDVFRMKLAGGNPASKAEGVNPQNARSNYFIGNDPANWRTGVPNYGRVRFREVYPGIDLVYYGNDGELEYDWIVQPGADLSKIRLRFSGVKKITVDRTGDLVLTTADGEIREKKPMIYQKSGAEIAGGYLIHGREVKFEVAKYDTRRTLVIDPVLVYTSYLGGSGNDNGTGIAVDAAGNAYVTGHTDSTDFPTVNPFQSTNPRGSSPGEGDGCVFISKVSADGSKLLYSTYLGGNGLDIGYAIAVDAAGDAFVTGSVQSTNFPTAHAFQNTNLGVLGNAFVTKLNPAGNALLFSTYLGGRQSDLGYGIAVDAAGNSYITGNTNSDNFPLENPIEAVKPGDSFPSAFVTKISADGSTLIYSTYLGGYKGRDIGQGIAVDLTGSAYVAGTTSASDFPTVNALQSASKNSSNTGFVTKINPAGSAFVYSTYLGGSVIDYAFAIAVDSSGNAYVTGRTNSSDFPTLNAFQGTSSGPTAFVSKIDASGSALVYSTYLGHSSAGYGIAVNAAGEAWVSGQAASGFPMVNPLTTNPYGIFASQFSADGTTLLSSSFVWNGSEEQGGVAVDSAGNAYLTGAVGPNNTSAATGFQSAFGGGQSDAFMVKISSGLVVPSISSVVNGASFQTPIVPNSWATILGSSLASVTDSWNNSITNGKLPTTLDGVKVTIGGQPAYLAYISPGQINFVAPEAAAGQHQVVVTNSAGSSAAFSVTVATYAPAFFLWPGSQAVATHQNYTLAAASGTFAGAVTVPAKPGEVIILWGTGFGPTTPAASPGVETPSSSTYATSTLPTVTINNVSATVYGAALAPGFAGLYQLGIQVPSSLGNGNWPIQATIGGVQSASGAVLAVQQ